MTTKSVDNINIRNIEYNDIEQVCRIQVNGWKTAYKGIIDDNYLKKLDVKTKIENRRKDYNKGGFIVAEQHGKIVGFCRYIDKNQFLDKYKEVDCEICALYVLPELKNKGIGKMMFSYVLNEFKELKKHNMILWCLEQNYSSRNFYEKMGGKVYEYKKIEIGEMEYDEVAYIYDLDKI